jgi:hypothetical protein
MPKYFTIIFTFMRKTREFHVIGLQIELHTVFYTKTTVNICSSKSRKGSSVSDRTTLLMEWLVNCSGANDTTYVEKTASGSMKVT